MPCPVGPSYCIKHTGFSLKPWDPAVVSGLCRCSATEPQTPEHSCPSVPLRCILDATPSDPQTTGPWKQPALYNLKSVLLRTSYCVEPRGIYWPHDRLHSSSTTVSVVSFIWFFWFIVKICKAATANGITSAVNLCHATEFHIVSVRATV